MANQLQNQLITGKFSKRVSELVCSLAKQKWENCLNFKVTVVQDKLPFRYICKKVTLRIGEPNEISCTENKNDLVNKIKIPSTEHIVLWNFILDPLSSIWSSSRDYINLRHSQIKDVCLVLVIGFLPWVKSTRSVRGIFTFTSFSK